MMVNYPFFSFSPFRRYPYYPSSSPLTMANSTMRRKSSSEFENGNAKSDHSLYHSNRNSKKNIPNEFLNKEKSESRTITSHQKTEEDVFHIFGLKLYSDDLLLICLIFFLYQEGVQDQYLFISLILLLLS